MSGEHIALGIVLTAVAGGLAWEIARRFILRYNPARQFPRALAGGVILLMALLGAYLGWVAPSLSHFAAALVLTTLLLIITLVDFGVRRIPNDMILALLAWAALQILWLQWPGWSSALLGLLAGGGAFWLLALLGRGALGLGDVKLAAALGAILGFPTIFYALFWGIVLGGLAALGLLLSRRAGLKSRFAYGPYLAAGAWLIYLAQFRMLP